MAATRIKVSIVSAVVQDDADMFGAGEWSFASKIVRVASGAEIAFGASDQEFEVNTGDSFNIDHSTEIDIEGDDTRLEVIVQGTDEDLFFDDDVGKVKVVLNTPIVHNYDLYLTSDTKNYTMRIKIDVVKETSSSTGTITTILQNADANTYNTLHDEMLSKMVHINPVTPVPWTTGIPPLAKGVQALTASPQVDFSVKSGDPLNGLINPAVIVTLDPKDPEFGNRVARVRITQFRPANLDLSKLIWKVASGKIKFWNGSSGVKEIRGGQEVKAYGVNHSDTDEDCKIEVRWDSEGSPLLATYVAIVGKPKYIWCRGNIIRCSTASIGGVTIRNPSVTVADVKSHIAFSNVILWQAGLEMVMDPDGTCYNGAVKKDDGIFEVTNAANYTFNMTKDDTLVAPLLNARQGIFNMGYLHSIAGRGGLLGSATDRRLSPSETMVNLHTTPSVAWVRPTGVFPDADSKNVAMKRMGPSSQRDSSLKPLCGDGKDATLSNLSACFMTQNVKRRLARGNITLPHELGHVLGLHHRGNGGGQTVSSYDKVDHQAGPRKGRGHPWLENFMCYGDDARRQDLDTIQAKVIRANPLVKTSKPGATPTPTPPPTPPPTPSPKAVPTAWLPTEADRILAQEYLGGTKQGLTHTNYNLGSSGPKGDGVDGVVGPKTKQAIKDFQRDHGELSVDGLYGPNTRGAFDKELNGGSS